MLQKIEEAENPQIGETYLVRCGWPMPGTDLSVGNPLYIPLLGPIHDDPELGFAEYHYHIDWRFVPVRTYKTMLRMFGLDVEDAANLMGKAAVAALSHNSKEYIVPNLQLRETEYRPLKMKRLHTPFPNWVTWLGKLERKYLGSKLLKHRTCPHRGVSCAGVAESKNEPGLLICPGHGLAFCAKTGEMQVRAKRPRPPYYPG